MMRGLQPLCVCGTALNRQRTTSSFVANRRTMQTIHGAELLDVAPLEKPCSSVALCICACSHLLPSDFFCHFSPNTALLHETNHSRDVRTNCRVSIALYCRVCLIEATLLFSEVSCNSSHVKTRNASVRLHE